MSMNVWIGKLWEAMGFSGKPMRSMTGFGGFPDLHTPKSTRLSLYSSEWSLHVELDTWPFLPGINPWNHYFYMVLDSFGMFWAQSVPGKPIVFRHPQFVQTRRKEDLFDLRERLEELTQVPYSDGDMETQIDQRVGHLEIFLGNTLHNILEVVFPIFSSKGIWNWGFSIPKKQ